MAKPGCGCKADKSPPATAPQPAQVLSAAPQGDLVHPTSSCSFPTYCSPFGSPQGRHPKHNRMSFPPYIPCFASLLGLEATALFNSPTTPPKPQIKFGGQSFPSNVLQKGREMAQGKRLGCGNAFRTEPGRFQAGERRRSAPHSCYLLERLWGE